MSGAPGHTGHTGTTGRRGLQGTPYGPPGTTFYSPSGRVTLVDTRSSTNVNVAVGEYGALYILNNAEADNYYAQLPETMNTADGGAFWTFLNNGLRDVNLNFTNGTVSANGEVDGSYMTLAVGNSITIVYTGIGTSYIAV
jgi:hypothetical protein